MCLTTTRVWKQDAARVQKYKSRTSPCPFMSVVTSTLHLKDTLHPRNTDGKTQRLTPLPRQYWISYQNFTTFQQSSPRPKRRHCLQQEEVIPKRPHPILFVVLTDDAVTLVLSAGGVRRMVNERGVLKDGIGMTEKRVIMQW